MKLGTLRIFTAIGSAVILGVVFVTAVVSGIRNRNTHQRAVEEAVRAVEYHLPQLARNARSAKATPFASDNLPLDLLRRRLASVADHKLHALTGEEYRQSGGISTHHYLVVERQAEFENGSLPVLIYVMHPKAYSLQVDPGLEITNELSKEGLGALGKLRFLPSNDGFIVLVEHSDLAHGFGLFK